MAINKRSAAVIPFDTTADAHAVQGEISGRRWRAL